jgi:hypothetical protein
MSNSRFAAGILFALFAAFDFSGCASASARTARTWHPATYAIVVADDQGVLPQATFKKIEIAIVQYLIDGGFVRSDQRYVGDLMRADVVFRVRIAWQNAAATSFTVAEVAPSYANGAPAPAAVAEVEPDYGAWYDDPWFYGDYYGGYFYGPWGPFLTVAPFLPIYAIDHHRHPFPPVAHRPPANDKRHEHQPFPNGDRAASPPPPTNRWRDNNGKQTSPTADRTGAHPGPANNSAARQRAPDSTSPSSTWHGRTSGSDAPRYSSPPQRNYSSPQRDYSPPQRDYSSHSAPSHSAPSYSAPAPSSPPPAASSSSSSGDRDSNSRTQQR